MARKWTCEVCSTLNADSEVCFVCGSTRSGEIADIPEETVAEEAAETRAMTPREGKVVYSSFALLAESTKRFFCSVGRFFAGGWKRIKRKKKASRVEAPRVEAPRVEAPRVEAPRAEAPRAEESSGVSEVWPEHGIEMDTAQLTAKSFERFEKTEKNGIKGYNLYRTDGQCRFMRVETLLALKMARRV